MTLYVNAPLDQSKNSFAKSLATFGIWQSLEEFLPAEALHLAECFLDSTPVSDCFL